MQFEAIVCILLMAVFTAGGLLATYQAMREIFVTDFRVPCYISS